MSVNWTGGIAASASGTPRAQAAGADTERAAADEIAASRRSASLEQAASAAGIAETDGRDLAAFDRDADGRQPWLLRWANPAHGAAANGRASDRDNRADAHLGTSLDLTV